MKTCLKLLTLLVAMLGVSGYTLPGGIEVDRVVVVNNIHVIYGGSGPQCELFLRHAVGAYPKGYGGISCKKYSTSKDDDVVETIFPNPQEGIPATPLRKKDLISLDDFPAWSDSVPLIRSSFTIAVKDGGPDPEINSSNLPYDQNNAVLGYMLFDKEGYEINLKSKTRTGYRFYDFLGVCYLATVRKPRAYKYIADCKPKEKYLGFPKTIDTTSHPWINIMNQNTVDVGESMPSSVDIYGSNPVKPLVYSDFPIGNDGKVTKGRAMCMADCAPGMLMKLLHAGQSIWGPSGKPPADKQ